jgi:hypothetical protein
MTADEYFRQRAGKTAEEMIKDGELMSPVYALILMRDYADHLEAKEEVKASKTENDFKLLEAILKEVSDVTGICICDLKSRSRKREIAEARQFYFKRARVQTTAGIVLIGSLVGRDHATVIFGVRVVDGVREVRSKYEKLFTRFEKEEVSTQTMDMLIGRGARANMTSPFESIRSEVMRPYSGYRVHSF